MAQGVTTARLLIYWGMAFISTAKKKNAARLSLYINDNKEKDYPKSTHFKIHNKRICADSQNDMIHIGKESYPIDLGDVLDSFDRVLEKAFGI
ncbi:hypothetical protein [Helicobacter bizzozeronii]|uniref:hypothetical protein n=1 Tax=Helicobacter bizzozeronii TaxID=56877 RepID=UPI0013158256|nr:hypothetical protein [Helicobacter bizzozeronii]